VEGVEDSSMPYINNETKAEIAYLIDEEIKAINSAPSQMIALRQHVARFMHILCTDHTATTLLPVLNKYSIDEIEGVLNYIISTICMRTTCRELRYKNINRTIGELERVWAIIAKVYSVNETGPEFSIGTPLSMAFGVIRCVVLELYLRIGRPYEDYAILRNGDIEVYAEATKIISDLVEDLEP